MSGNSNAQSFVALSVPAKRIDLTERDTVSTVVSVSIGLALLVVIWSMLGLLAFVWSLVCIGRSGSAADKSIGIVLALITGPLFFFYLKLNKGYCK